MSTSERCLASRGRAAPFTKDRARNHPLSRILLPSFLFFHSRVTFVPRVHSSPSSLSILFRVVRRVFAVYVFDNNSLSSLASKPLLLHLSMSSRSFSFVVIIVLTFLYQSPSTPIKKLWTILSDGKTLQVTRQEWNLIIDERGLRLRSIN